MLAGPGATNRRNRVRTVFATALFISLFILSSLSRAAFAQTYGLESETGELTGARRDANSGSAAIKNQLPPLFPGNPEPPSMKKPGLFRARPSSMIAEPQQIIITEPQPVPEPEPRQPEPIVEPEPAPSPELSPAVVINKPATPPQKPVPPRADKLPLYRNASFSVNSKLIEYNYRSKKFQASGAAIFGQGDITIYADEIRADLNRALLSARGSVTIEFTRTQKRTISAESLVYDMNTQEMAVVDKHGESSNYSLASIGSFEEYTDNSSMQEVVLLPSGDNPSLQGIGEIPFPESDPRDIITSILMSSSAASGLTFFKAAYIFDDGRRVSAPVLTSRRGELFEKTARANYASAYFIPAIEYGYTGINNDFNFASNPRGRGLYNTYNQRSWNMGADEWDQRYQLSKSYIRGNDNLSFALEKYGTWFGITSIFSHYEFDRLGGMLRARVINYNQNSFFRITKQNDFETLYRLNTKKYFFNAGITSSKSVSVDDNYYGSEPINEDVSQRRNYYDITLEKKPRQIGRSAFSYSLFSELYLSAYRSKYLVRPAEYSNTLREKEFEASVFTRDYRLAPRLFAAARADWRFFSYRYSYAKEGSYSFNEGSHAEYAYGSAEIRWRFSQKGVLGTDYLWKREMSNGSYSWVPFVSYAPARKINLRLSARYMPENTFINNRIGYPRNIFGETLDVSWKLGRSQSVTASFDLDNAIAGASLYTLSYNAAQRFGDISFSVLKHPEVTGSYSTRSMYRYALSLYFR